MAIKDTYYHWILTSIFFALSFIGILHHEIWLDEAHCWLTARDNETLGDLLNELRYDGHPHLWNILLYYTSKISTNPFAMQLLHIGISTCAVAILIHFSNYSRLFKLLYIFSYYTFYEYNIISRNFSILLLFLFLSVKIINDKNRNYILLAITLSLLANTHLFGFIIAFAASAYVIYLEKPSAKDRGVLMAGIILIAGLSVSAYQLVSFRNSPLMEEINYLSKIPKAVSMFLNGLAPFPDFCIQHFWNTNLFFNHYKIVSYLLSATLFFLPLILLIKKPVTALFFYICIIGVTVTILLTHIGSMRHFGIVFILLIASIWLSQIEPSNKWYENNKTTRLIFRLNEMIHNKALIIILGIQALSGITIYAFDLPKPFAEGKNVANYLIKNGFDKCTIMTFHPPTPTITAYLSNKTYLLYTQEYRSYVKYDDIFLNKYNEDILLSRAFEMTKTSQKCSILVLFLNPIQTDSAIKKRFELLKVFNSSMIKTETFYVYKIDPN